MAVRAGLNFSLNMHECTLPHLDLCTNCPPVAANEDIASFQLKLLILAASLFTNKDIHHKQVLGL